jgi:hypothetical protein
MERGCSVGIPGYLSLMFELYFRANLHQGLIDELPKVPI